MIAEKLRVLLLDDEDDLRELVTSHLQDSFHYQVDGASNGRQALELVNASQGRYDVALLDQVLEEGLDGIQVMREIKRQYPDIECIIFTGWGYDSAMEALRAGAYRYLTKPVYYDELGLIIGAAAEHRKLKRELETTRQENEWLQTFLEVGKATTSVLKFDQVLEQVRQQVGRLVDVSGLRVVLYDEKKQMLDCELCYDRGERQSEWHRPFAADQGLTDWVIAHRQPLLIRDYPNDTLPVPTVQPAHEVVKSWLGVPLIAQDRVIGALTVRSHEPHWFCETDQQILTAVASQVAIAIENARLYSALTETTRRLEGLIASSFDAVVAIDQDGRMTVFNKQAETMFSYTADEMLGRSVVRLHHSIEEAKKIHDMVSSGGAISGYETVLKDKEGKQIQISLSAISIKDDEGNEIGQAGFMRDLRKIRLLEDQLRALVEVGQIIGSTLDLDQVFDLVVRSAVAAVPSAQKGALHLHDANTGMLRIRASFGYSPELVKAAALKVGEGRAGWVYEHAVPLNVGNVGEHPLTKRFGYPEEEEQKSSVCVPIMLGRQAIGALSVESVTHYDAFGPEDVNILATLANQAATAIGNARLYGSVHRRLEELDRLRTVGQAIVDRVVEKPKEVLEQVATGACQVIGADSAIIYPYLETKGTYDVANIGSHGLKVKKEYDAAKRRGELTSMTGIVLKEKRVIVDDISSGVDRSGKVQVERVGFLKREGVASFVGVSLVVEEEPLGVLFVNFRAAHYFADDELSIISILANQAAVAIRQTRLFDQAKKELERRKKEQEATQAVARLLSSVFDLNAVWQEIVDGAMQITRAERGVILLWDKQQNRLGLQVSHGVADRDKRHLKDRLARTDGMTNWIMRHQQAVLIDDRFRHPAVDWYIPVNPDVRAVLVMPVFLESFLTGVIVLESPRVAAFSQDDLRLVENLAVYAGIAVNNAMQYVEIEQNALLREGLLKAGRGITALKEPQEVLQAMADGVREALACDVVTLYAYDQAKEEIGSPVVCGALRRPDKLLEKWNVRKESVVGQLVASGCPHYSDDSAHDPMMTAGSFVRREGIRSSAGIPLRVGDETVGVLFVNYRAPYHFAPQEQAEIELFATQAAIAIYNARLYKSIRRQSQHRQALYEASKAITAGFTIERKQVLNRIVQQAVERITGVDGPKATWGVIHLYDKATHELYPESVYPPEALPELKAKLGNRRSLNKSTGRVGITGRAVLERTPQRVKDVRADPDYLEFDPTTRSELVVPLLDDNKVLGVLSVESDKAEAFDRDDEQALMGLAELAVIAVKNAEQARQLSRTNAFAVMGAWGAESAHEVNREVGNIRLAVTLLQRLSNLPQQAMQYLAEIDHCAGRLGLPALPEHAPQPGEVLEFKDASLADEVVKEVIQTMQQELGHESPTSVQLDLLCEGVRVAMHPYWLSRLVYHLVWNAIRSTVSEEKDNRITVRTRVQDTLVEIAVEDTGRGVPVEQTPLLFNQPIPREDGHQGRGLLVVSYIAEAHGGSARLVRNRIGEGACFAFYVPLAQPTDTRRRN